MSVPVTAVDKNRGPVAPQNYIWPPWQILTMQPVSVSACPEDPANRQLGRGVLSSDSGHVETSRYRRMDVHSPTSVNSWSDEIGKVDVRLTLSSVV